MTKYLRGGDGSGGPYDWNDMTLVPDCSTTLTQRQAIGALTYDAGVAVNMKYTSGGSGADMSDADAAMTSTFHYSNSIYGYNNYNNISTTALSTMLNPNLDWGNPVILGLTYPPRQTGTPLWPTDMGTTALRCIIILTLDGQDPATRGTICRISMIPMIHSMLWIAQYIISI